jgi:hypothetical protein
MIKLYHVCMKDNLVGHTGREKVHGNPSFLLRIKISIMLRDNQQNERCLYLFVVFSSRTLKSLFHLVGEVRRKQKK